MINIGPIGFGAELERRSLLLRSWLSYGWFGRRNYCEWAYIVLGIRGLALEFESPSDWHEERRCWIRIGFGLGLIAFSLPWYGAVPPDEYQCSGPRYGFKFFGDTLTIYYGKDTGRPGDPHKTFWMPWSWSHREHKVLSEPEQHPYAYRLQSGELQQRTATIKRESRLWTRYWIPWRLYKEYIDVEFDDEVGERSGGWKGGTTGCGYDLKPGETNRQCLRRMERERFFT